jgi:hypothetical protein
VGRVAFKRRVTPLKGNHVFALPSCIASFHLLSPRMGNTRSSSVAELPELFQLKCLSPALEARPHLNGNNPSIPRI